MSTRKTAVDKAIEKLTRDRDAIDAAIAALKNAQAVDAVEKRSKRRSSPKPVPLAKAE